MNKEHHYTALITWTGNMGTGTSGYTKYERSHLIQSGDKAVIEASSDAPFRGDISKHNPEDLFLSSIAYALVFTPVCRQWCCCEKLYR
jgi:organic hydroperoxide reductase OsmC/OhrA